MARSKYINTFDTTADYNNYIESALPEFPNVGYDKQAGKVNIRRQSPNDYQIWGTTTSTSNFNIKLNNTYVEVTVDPDLGEFYLTGWTGTLTSLYTAFYGLSHITSLKKLSLDTSSVTFLSDAYSGCFQNCSNLEMINLEGNTFSSVTKIKYLFKNCTKLKTIYLREVDFSNVAQQTDCFSSCSSLTDIYINVEATLNKLTNNLSSQGNEYIPSSATIHYNDVDYKWQNNAWTPQS